MNKSQIYSVNWPDVSNVHVAAAALNLLIANLSRSAVDEFVGSGLRAHNPERANQRRQAKDEDEKHTRKIFTILLDQINERIRELNAQLAQLKADLEELQQIEQSLEAELGGLDEMGGELGIDRIPGEADEAHRKRLKLEIDKQIQAGNIDPASLLAQWSTNRDYIAFNLSQQATVKDEANRLQRAAASRDPETMQRALDEASRDGLAEARLQKIETAEYELDDRFIQTAVDVEVVDGIERESALGSFMSARLKGEFTTAHDREAAELDQDLSKSDTQIPGINPTNS
ncbi:MAG: hypothetical protein O7D86_13130 [Proteobacteria bacterium]|nr:hypothetical protein [Pseudomonadota bacterium]